MITPYKLEYSEAKKKKKERERERERKAKQQIRMGEKRNAYRILVGKPEGI
jgi:hypothetical protein